MSTGTSHRKIGASFVGAILGGVFCLAAIKIADATGSGLNVPSPGGEDDFDVRFKLFATIVFPAFALLGGWIGFTAAKGTRSWWRAAIGGAAGSLVALAGGRLSPALFGYLSTSEAANRAVGGFFAGWALLGIAGAVLASRRAGG